MKFKYLRYISGFCLLALILASFYFSNIALFLMSIFFIITAMIEYRKMFKSKEIYPHKFLPEIIGILCAFIFISSKDLSSHHLITPVLLSGIIFSFILTVIKNKKPYIITSLSTIAAIMLIFCGLYIIKLTYYFEQHNAWYMISVYFLAVLSGDWAASVIGPRFKIKPLAEEISPNKTWGGALSNLIFSCLSCLLLAKFLEFPLKTCLLLGIIVSLFSQLGDLSISTFKRELGLKHSGSFFCGYGGMLDRMDAFIFSAPAAYYFLFLATII